MEYPDGRNVDLQKMPFNYLSMVSVDNQGNTTIYDVQEIKLSVTEEILNGQYKIVDLFKTVYDKRLFYDASAMLQLERQVQLDNISWVKIIANYSFLDDMVYDNVTGDNITGDNNTSDNITRYKIAMHLNNSPRAVDCDKVLDEFGELVQPFYEIACEHDLLQDAIEALEAHQDDFNFTRYVCKSEYISLDNVTFRLGEDRDAISLSFDTYLNEYPNEIMLWYKDGKP